MQPRVGPQFTSTISPSQILNLFWDLTSLNPVRRLEWGKILAFEMLSERRADCALVCARSGGIQDWHKSASHCSAHFRRLKRPQLVRCIVLTLSPMHSLPQDEQSKAAQALVAETMAIQNSQPALDADEVAACFEVEDLLAIFSQSTVYVFKRLIRGLASGRAGARQGFALALTLLLAEIPAIRPPMAIKLIYSLVEPVGMHKVDWTG